MSGCAFGFCAAVALAVVRRERIPVPTGAITGALLLVMASTQLTLGLWRSALLNYLCGGLWFLLAWRSRS